MTQTLTGTLHGRTIKLDNRPELPDGTRVRVFLEQAEDMAPTAEKGICHAAWARAKARMKRGYPLGGGPYPRREELYDRFER